jgi:site-specific recombinase XerD
MFLLAQEAARHTSRTIETYRETLTRFLDWLGERDITTPEAITPHLIREFLVHLERRGLQSATVHKHARGIKTFCNFLVREDLLDVSPMAKVDMPKLEKKIHPPFTVDEVERLLDACGKDVQGLRDKAMVLVLLDTGLRASKFASMNVGDVDRHGSNEGEGQGAERALRAPGSQGAQGALAVSGGAQGREGR